MNLTSGFNLIALISVLSLFNGELWALNNPNYEVKTVVIDAGHGGHDPGCHGAHSNEKHITLAVAKKLGAYIEERYPEVNVIYTRKTDVFVELDERANIANRNDADLFISIHCNAAGNKNVNGTETYVMGLHRSKANLDVAKRENEVIMLEDDYMEKYDGFDPSSPEAHIVFMLYQSAYLEQSIKFADLVEKQFRDRAMRYSRGVKQAGFLVLYKTNSPSVLIESGFLTNRTEENFLADDYGQDLIASAIYRAFREYKEKMEQRDSWPVSISSPSQSSEEAYNEVEAAPVPIESTESTESTEITTTEYVKSHTISEENISVPAESTVTYYPPVKAPEEIVSMDPNMPITYKVQIFASKDGEMLKKVDYTVIKRIEREELESGLIKYLTGNFKDLIKVEEYLKEVRASGFNDAFIVRYQNGMRL